jgi:hypothetical protein
MINSDVFKNLIKNSKFKGGAHVIIDLVDTFHHHLYLPSSSQTDLNHCHLLAFIAIDNVSPTSIFADILVYTS